MVYGPLPPKRLPNPDQQKVVLLAERWARAAAAQQKWAEEAKTCVDYLEGRQIKEEIRKALEREGRPSWAFNKIGRLVRLVLGYFANNRTDVSYLPSADSISNQRVAEILTQIYKTIAENSQSKFTDLEVVLDGISTGRGYYDYRLEFCDNDFGEIRGKPGDPFATYLDPNGADYDINACGYICDSRWVSEDEVRYTYGDQAARLVGNLFQGNYFTEFPTKYVIDDQEITPVRSFGAEEDTVSEWAMVNGNWYQFIDPLQKNIRLLDFQYWVTKMCDVFVDLETGDRSVIPEAAEIEKITHGRMRREQWIAKALYHAEKLGNPLRIVRRPVKRVRWTTLIGDIMVYDDWSPYDSFTKIGYFPYFRRGQTRGMVHDLIAPQDEYNKRRLAQIEVVTRMPHGGWSYHESSLDPREEAKLHQYGASPGFQLKWKGDKEPRRLEQQGLPPVEEQLIERSSNEFQDISGINESALGELDRVESGRAIEARQRQAVIAFQLYVTNWSRTMELRGRKILNLVQRHYTEERIFRILGEDGREVQYIINQLVMSPDGASIVDKLNDITLGKYTVAVDETPMAASFQNAQFEEFMLWIEKMGPAAAQIVPAIVDIMIDVSSIPRKEDIKARLAKLGLGEPAAVPGGLLPPPGGGGGPMAPSAGAGGFLRGPSIDASVEAGNPVQVSPTGGV